MSRTEFGITAGLPWLVFVGGAVALAVCRRRAPRAAGFALPVVVILAVVSGYIPLLLLTGSLVPAGWRAAAREPYIVASTFAFPAGFVLLAVAAMMDRRLPEAR